MLIVRIVRIVRIVMVLVLISMINILSYQNKRTVTSYKTISAVIPTAMSRIISRDSNKHKRTNIFRSLSSISNSNNHPIIDKTRIKNKESVWKITYNSSLLFIGSCFSENISKQLTSRKFNVQTNPFGILFNPHSISTCIKNIVLCNYYSSNDISMDTIRKELYFSYDHHSSFSSLDKNIIIQNINNHISSGHKAICDTDVLFITLGTAKVYTHLESNKQVANCHKRKRIICVVCL